MGLATAAAGGEVLVVEAKCLPGRGRLHVTGTVGPLARESAAVALTWVRSHPDRFAAGAGARFHEATDVHLHLADAGRLKDGPSAGVPAANEADVAESFGGELPCGIGVRYVRTMEDVIETVQPGVAA